jgi:MarR family transcriptional regulator, protease production regulatory protein HPr
MILNLLVRQKVLLVVRALYFCMENQWAEIGKKHNISPAQQHILFLLSTNNDALTPTKISELGCWHISTVTRLIKPLQKNGLITVKTNETQPRYKTVSLTAEGTILLEKILDTVKSMDQFPFNMSHLSEEEILYFLECGQRILDVHKGEDFRIKVINARMNNCDY